MPLTRPQLLLREAVTFVVVVVAAAIVGYGLGIVLNHQFGTVKSDTPRRTPPAATSGAAATSASAPGSTSSAAAATTDTRAAAAATVSPATSLTLADEVSLKVDSAKIEPATKPAGIAAKAARLTVQASVTNDGTKAVTAPIERLFIRYGGANVRVDSNAFELAGDLVKPIPAGKTVSGELHFETRGAVTTAMKDLKEAAVRFGPQAIVARLG